MLFLHRLDKGDIIYNATKRIEDWEGLKSSLLTKVKPLKGDRHIL